MPDAPHAPVPALAAAPYEPPRLTDEEKAALARYVTEDAEAAGAALKRNFAPHTMETLQGCEDIARFVILSTYARRGYPTSFWQQKTNKAPLADSSAEAPEDAA